MVVSRFSASTSSLFSPFIYWRHVLSRILVGIPSFLVDAQTLCSTASTCRNLLESRVFGCRRGRHWRTSNRIPVHQPAKSAVWHNAANNERASCPLVGSYGHTAVCAFPTHTRRGACAHMAGCFILYGSALQRQYNSSWQ
ncbi:hypothetical protein BDV10DRAFT_42838 [Aspergillus recurvatus]